MKPLDLLIFHVQACVLGLGFGVWKENAIAGGWMAFTAIVFIDFVNTIVKLFLK